MKFIKSPNFSKDRGAEISAIVIHYTSGETLDGAVSWFKNPKASASAHYIIDTNGSVVQMVADAHKAWHAGVSELDGVKNVNKFSIGIELVNWGELRKKKNEFFAWPENYSRPYNETKLGKPKLADGKWWAPYPDKQINACIELVAGLRDMYEVASERVVGHCHVAPGRKFDPGPLFPFEQLRKESEPFNLDLLYTNYDASEKELKKKHGATRNDE